MHFYNRVISVHAAAYYSTNTRHLTTNNLFADEQHGFRTGRSCTTQLISAMETWTNILQCGIPIDVIYLDFSKAFDS